VDFCHALKSSRFIAQPCTFNCRRWWLLFKWNNITLPTYMDHRVHTHSNSIFLHCCRVQRSIYP